MSAWSWLFLAIAAEVSATSLLKASQSLSRLAPSIGAILVYGVSIFCHARALTVIPLGVAYAIWSGLGILSLALIGWAVYQQKPDSAAWLGMGLIVTGILVIRFFSKIHPV